MLLLRKNNFNLLLPNFINLFFFRKNSNTIYIFESYFSNYKLILPKNCKIILFKNTLNFFTYNNYPLKVIHTQLASFIFENLLFKQLQFYFKGIGYRLYLTFFNHYIGMKISYGYSLKIFNLINKNDIFIKKLNKKFTFFEILSSSTTQLTAILQFLRSLRKQFRYKSKGFFILGNTIVPLKKSKKQQQR